MWNDTEIPLAYLITFRCYGTWLHGDIRGSVDRNHSAFGTARLQHEPARKGHVRTIIKHESVILDARRRDSVERALRETCSVRNWHLHALNVRTNHAHAVVAAGSKKPEIVLNAFKANATRLLREEGLWDQEHSPWVEKGSKRYLWNEKSVWEAYNYVLNGQGADLPDF